MVTCAHLDQVVVGRPEQVSGCEDCLSIGGWWVHLRVCRSCGHVGCCDSSPHRHATAHWKSHADHPIVRHASAHARDSGHSIVTSVEPGEDWSYCYLDDVAFVLESES